MSYLFSDINVWAMFYLKRVPSTIGDNLSGLIILAEHWFCQRELFIAFMILTLTSTRDVTGPYHWCLPIRDVSVFDADGFGKSILISLRIVIIILSRHLFSPQWHLIISQWSLDIISSTCSKLHVCIDIHFTGIEHACSWACVACDFERDNTHLMCGHATLNWYCGHKSWCHFLH